MKKKLSPQHNELYNRTDEVLHYLWDPVRVSDSPYAREEYWEYVPHVFSRLSNGEPNESIVNYLLKIEIEMGVNPDKKNAERVVEVLDSYRKKILK